MKYPSLEYDAAVAKNRENIRLHKLTTMTPEEMQKEIAATTEGIFIEPIQTIESTGPELDIIAHGLLTGEVIVPVKKRGRPRGSKNRPKEQK